MDFIEAFEEDARSSGSSTDDSGDIRRGFGEFDEEDNEPHPEAPADDDHPGGEEECQQQCLELFASNDYIMEPEVFDTIKMYFRAGGMPAKVVELLSDNYTACGQTANILAEWMLNLGMDPEEVMSMIENHLQELIVRHFDPKKADAIFLGGEAPSWLAEMIEHYPWRRLFYRLSEEYPDCLLLNFTIKLISDAGYQQEITSGITAAQQIEIFSQVIRTHLIKLFTEHEENQEATLREFLKLATYGEHTYLFTQVVLDELSKEAKGGSSVRRIMQEMEKFALSRGYNVIPISISLDEASETHPKEAIAIASMMSKNAINTADITVLYNAYNLATAPPVSLIRRPQFLELLVDLLFTGGSKIQVDHKPKYVYLLAYACGVSESYNTKNRLRKTTVNKEDVKQISQAIEKAQAICAGNKAAGELIAEIPELYKCIRYAVVAMGVLKWVESVIFEPNYFELNPDPVPVHLVLLDEVANIHSLMHSQILNLYIKVFERTFQELDVLIQLNLKRTVLDRMVHLLSRGHVIPTIRFMKKCADEKNADVSLIRHFVSEVIDIIAPPCSEEFLTLFLPLLDNEAITGSLRSEKRDDPISVFLANCRKS